MNDHIGREEYIKFCLHNVSKRDGYVAFLSLEQAVCLNTKFKNMGTIGLHLPKNIKTHLDYTFLNK